MGYIEGICGPDEKIVLQTSLHWFTLVLPIFIVLSAIFLLIKSFVTLGAILFIFGIVWLFATLFERMSSEYGITTARVILKTGIIKRSSTEIRIEKVESVSIEEPLFGRIFGFGKLIISGSGGSAQAFNSVANVKEFRNAINAAIGNSKKGN